MLSLFKIIAYDKNFLDLDYFASDTNAAKKIHTRAWRTGKKITIYFAI